MATEIELKAHVPDSEAIKLLLTQKAEYKGAFEKEDSYWYPDENYSRASGLPSSGLRIRADKRTLPDGTVELATFVTYKIKEVRDNIEINDEREFEICSSYGQAKSDFEDFLRRIGLKSGISKRKRGWAFSGEGITAELAEVEGLGWFVELEIMTEHAADNIRDSAIADAQKRLLDFLACLGIEKEAIEGRYYTEMLRERN